MSDLRATAPDGIDTGDTILKCPKCGFIGNVDHFDGLGADEDKVFCVRCHHHGRMRQIKRPPAVPKVTGQQLLFTDEGPSNGSPEASRAEEEVGGGGPLQ